MRQYFNYCGTMKSLIFIQLLSLFSYCIKGDTFESNHLNRWKSGFIFTYPMDMFSGTKTNVCLNLFDVNLPTQAMLDLKVNKDHYIMKINITSENFCFLLNVPVIHQHIKVSASIDFQIQLNGTLFWFRAEDPPYIYHTKYTIFIETDKNFYKLGEKVRMRALVLDHDLKPPSNYKIPSIKLYNPYGNTVAIWNNVPTELGLAKEEFQLAKDTTVGKWKIDANGYTQTFQVKKYILPRFQVQLFTPKIIYVGMKTFYFHICAKYPYGKHVQGTAQAKLSYAINSEMREVHKSKEIKNGCVKFKFTSDDLRFSDASFERRLFITGTVSEKGSNAVVTQSTKVRVAHREYQMKFSDEQKYFHPGFPYRGKLKIFDAVIPIKNETIQICCEFAIKKVWNIKKTECRNFTIVMDNVISFTVVPVKENVVQLNLRAFPVSRRNFEISASIILKKWYSKSNNFIHVEKNHRAFPKCGSTLQFSISYLADYLDDLKNVTFNYILISRDEILKMGQINHRVKKQKLNLNALKNLIGQSSKFIGSEKDVDKFIFKLTLDSNIYTKFNLLIYYVTKEEVIAGTADISVEKCLPNKVQAKWINNRLYPSEIAALRIKTDNNSLCSISAVDKATVFLGSYKSLSASTILKSFEQADRRLFSFKRNCISSNAADKSANTYINPWDLRKKRQAFSNTSNNLIVQEHSSHYDTYEIFKGSDIGVITNLRIISKPCMKGQVNPHFLVHKPNDLEYEIENGEQAASIRRYFPESWLWDLVLVDKHGETTFERPLPDSITNWITNVVCISPNKGVGLSHPFQITSFKPFFLDIITPYSIKRNEILHLRIIVHNYLNHSIPVKLTMDVNNGLELLNNGSISNRFCLEQESSASHTYHLRSSELGYMNISASAEIDSSYPEACGPDIVINRKDSVTKTFLVESEGYLVENVKNAVLCANDSLGNNNISWKIILPEDVAPKTTKSRIIVNSDLMGPMIQNLENLIVVPTGCGEQIMAMLTPNLYVLKYLKSNNKLTKSIYQRAIRNMKIGYQRILDYVHSDGSFSAFGYHDPTGSMFLTAFVVKTLKSMKEYTYVDDNVIQKAISWITKNQLENGCFDPGHHVFHELGGMSSENSTTALTAYVLISLLESNTNLNETIRTNAKYCIRGLHQPDKYTLSISTYALYLVEWFSQADRNLQKLLDMITNDGELIWWKQSDLPLSVNIEMASYILMSLLYRNSSQNLHYANYIIRWLHTKIGSRGEFISTQDTSVALDALHRYAILVNRGDANLHVTINTDTEVNTVSVSKKDRLKMKQIDLDDVPSDVNINIEGVGCILTQVVITYNVHHVNNSEAFRLNVDVEPVSTVDKCSVAIISPCIAYMGLGHSNMAMLEVTMPSGYEPDRDSLFELVNKENTKVKKFEELENRVVLYFTELTNEAVCVPFNINENVFVENIINSTVKLYDYYKPEFSVIKAYKVNTCESNVIAPISAVLDSPLQNISIDINDTNNNR